MFDMLKSAKCSAPNRQQFFQTCNNRPLTRKAVIKHTSPISGDRHAAERGRWRTAFKRRCEKNICVQRCLTAVVKKDVRQKWLRAVSPAVNKATRRAECILGICTLPFTPK
eukprot:gnl/TRDRNA2_/TRDRNA2_172039_c0_seq6.p1 gnl/TRDRNA2_/TRDRNA2_172039_c0~~gnl/TRDRNA2_/TRDRNA2_172039_c0_seq6.p1  ORF type:complete len:111 (+),score=5.29 gnl/TRDRNA2_/TRDRNA2_172039_c0_seq6:61-393(+)